MGLSFKVKLVVKAVVPNHVIFIPLSAAKRKGTTEPREPVRKFTGRRCFELRKLIERACKSHINQRNDTATRKLVCVASVPLTLSNSFKEPGNL